MARIRLAALRKTAGITQKDLADRLNISQGFLSSVENGKNPFPDERLADLKEAFPGVSIDDYTIKDTESTIYKVGSDNKHSPFTYNDSKVIEALHDVVKELAEVKREREEESKSVDIRTTVANPTTEAQLIKALNDNSGLHKEISELKSEIFRLKEILLRNGIDYEKKIATQ